MKTTYSDVAPPAVHISEDKRRKRVCLTCSQEHDLIRSILRQNSVHYNLSEGVVHADAREHGPSGQSVDGAIHQGVESNETDHVVREVFGRLDLCVVRAAGTLMEQVETSVR